MHAFIGNAAFPCIGAKAALAGAALHTHRARDIRLSDDDAAILAALTHFSSSAQSEQTYASLIVLFADTPDLSEADFEYHLWARLQALHARDYQLHDWDPRVSANPSKPRFGMSFGGKGYFVVGMHPRASRAARRAPCAALAFNPHAQFRQLKQSGHYQRLRDRIRVRDMALQGSLNPMLGDHETRPEAAQYSGRAVPDSWDCPFRNLQEPGA